MPGKHNENTKLLGFYADRELVGLIDAARDVARSQFLRDAVVEYMAKNGHRVPVHLKNAPDRTGKGGPKKKAVKYPAIPRKAKPASPVSDVDLAKIVKDQLSGNQS